MKKIVLIDGADTYQHAGAPAIHLGQPIEVEKEIAEHLLSKHCPTGRMFLEFSELDHRMVSIRLVDPTRDYFSPAVCIQGASVARVCGSIAPHLLRLKRDGRPIFEAVEKT
ncbi:hypothetical protein JCM30471_27390 [Desulfuromonas carbonis]